MPSLGDVLPAEQHQGFGYFAVAAGAADLLVIGLGAVGHIQMHDIADIGAVHAHAEGNGCDDDDRLTGAEATQRVPLVLRIEAGMERHRRIPLVPQPFRHSLRLRSAAAINDAAIALVPADEVQKLGGFTQLRRRRQMQVGAVEAGEEHPRVVESQGGEDVLPRARVSGRGQGDSRHIREQVRQAGKLADLRPEFMTPLRDAMRLINGDNRDRHAGQPVDGAITQQAFGRDV